MKLFVATLLLIFAAPNARASEATILFGPEFTFTSVQVLLKKPGVSETKYKKELIEAYQVWVSDFCKQKGCIVEDIAPEFGRGDSIRVTFQDGFHFSVGTDANVLEIRAQPITAEQWKLKSPVVQEVLFDGMAQIGLRPTSLYGSGHVSLDLETAFDGDVLKLRDFLVDYVNHPGLAEGILEDDPYNARSFTQLDEKSRSEFFSLVEQIDSGRITTIEAAIERMNSLAKIESGVEAFAIRFRPNRMEIRAVRAQANAADFALQAELFNSRIKYLEKLRASGNPVKVLSNVGANHAWQSLSQFYYYATDAGVAWKDAKKLLNSIRYNIIPAPLNRRLAFGERISCIYFLKKVRSDLITNIAELWY